MSIVAPASSADVAAVPLASRQDGRYPRPQVVRRDWVDLSGPWSFRHDDEDAGADAGWAAGVPSPRTITVPFPPESAASGIGDPGFHPVVWYSRTIGHDDLVQAGHGTDRPRVLLHFGAVDHRARVWIDGRFVGEHEGGHTPFTFDVTALLAETPDGADHVLVVRAEDDPDDVTQPRGKQDWHEEAHAIWYRRTTGIWQPVWLEAVPTTAIDALRWTPASPASTALSVRFRGRVPAGARLRVALRFDERDEDLGTTEWDATASRPTLEVTVPVARQRNGQAEDELTWSPETPRLVDAVLTLVDASGAVLDVVASYLGMRSVGVGGGRFLLNRQPYPVRSVLDQAFWPESHLAAPHPLAHRQEVELIKALGFNAARMHQKIEDPRFLYWADRLGLMVWGEAPAAYEFSPTAVRRLTAEWTAAVERDASHPSIVTWVPFNESWGIQHVVSDPAQQAYARALVDLTRALDPSRPVIGNDGWEQQDTDVVTSTTTRATAPCWRTPTATTRHAPAPSRASPLRAPAVRRRCRRPRPAGDAHRVRRRPVPGRRPAHRGLGLHGGGRRGRLGRADHGALRRGAGEHVPGRVVLDAADGHDAGDERPAPRGPDPEGPDRADPPGGDRQLTS